MSGVKYNEDRRTGLRTPGLNLTEKADGWFVVADHRFRAQNILGCFNPDFLRLTTRSRSYAESVHHAKE